MRMGGVGKTVPGDELVDEPEEVGAPRRLLIGIAVATDCLW